MTSEPPREYDFQCEKAGCDLPARVFVELTAADGSDTWWACREHALMFKQWVIQEDLRQLGPRAHVTIEEYER